MKCSPASGRVFLLLLKHLPAGVFAAQEDAFGVYGHGFVVVGFACFVDFKGADVGAFYGDA